MQIFDQLLGVLALRDFWSWDIGIWSQLAIVEHMWLGHGPKAMRSNLSLFFSNLSFSQHLWLGHGPKVDRKPEETSVVGGPKAMRSNMI